MLYCLSNNVKKNLIFSITFIGLGLANLALAQVTLPNPLGAVGDFPTLISNIATYVFSIVGVLSVLMFLWAGIIFLTSAGNDQKVSSAKKALFYAVVGLAIALSGTGLIQLVEYIILG